MRLSVTINVGLNASTNLAWTPQLSLDKRMLEAVRWGLLNLHGPLIVERVDPKGEPTLILHGKFSGGHIELHGLCTSLAAICEQDCVAYQADNDIRAYPGQLAGPRAELWAPFDPFKFHTPSRRFA